MIELTEREKNSLWLLTTFRLSNLDRRLETLNLEIINHPVTSSTSRMVYNSINEINDEMEAMISIRNKLK